MSEQRKSGLTHFESNLKLQKILDKDEFEILIESAMDIPNPTEEQRLLIQELKDCIRKLEESKR